MDASILVLGITAVLPFLSWTFFSRTFLSSRSFGLTTGRPAGKASSKGNRSSGIPLVTGRERKRERERERERERGRKRKREAAW